MQNGLYGLCHCFVTDGESIRYLRPTGKVGKVAVLDLFYTVECIAYL